MTDFYCGAGHRVPLSVALDQNSPWRAADSSGNMTQPNGDDLLILVAVTSTCCTVQASLKHLLPI